MTKFKIQVETKQLWELETDAKDIEQARKIRDEFYSQITTQIKTAVGEPIAGGYKLVEQWGGDDLSDNDITNMEHEELPEAPRAGRSAVYTLTLYCPHCGAEIDYPDETKDYKTLIDNMDSFEPSIVTCPMCDKQFIQKDYKDYD